MNDMYYLTDGGHVLISGATGAKAEYGGKTGLANWWKHNSIQQGLYNAGIHFTLPNKVHGYLKGTVVHDLTSFAELWRDGDREFVVVLDALDPDPTPYIETILKLDGDKIVVFDECHNYATSTGFALTISAYGNSDEQTATLRALSLTQRAWNLNESHLSNMPVKIWVGPFTSEAQRYFKTMEMVSVVPAIKENTAPYHWNVTDGGEYQHTNPPVPKEFAE